jgi:branched-chain amino acid transport system ATP-binding protein
LDCLLFDCSPLFKYRLTPAKVHICWGQVAGTTPRELLAKGIAFVPQGRNLFGKLSVLENLELGGITIGIEETRKRIPEILAYFPRIKERLNSKASSLSGGEQKQLEVGRALLLRPKVLLIDEPSIGLSPQVVHSVFELLRDLVAQGTTVLMVEQNVKSALKYSDTAIALESGSLVLHKPASEILADPNMDRLFLGTVPAV